MTLAGTIVGLLSLAALATANEDGGEDATTPNATSASLVAGLLSSVQALLGKIPVVGDFLLNFELNFVNVAIAFGAVFVLNFLVRYSD